MKCAWCSVHVTGPERLCEACGHRLGSWVTVAAPHLVSKYWKIEPKEFGVRQATLRHRLTRNHDAKRLASVWAGLAVGLAECGKHEAALAVAAAAIALDPYWSTGASCCNALTVLTGDLVRSEVALSELRDLIEQLRG